MKMYDYGFRWAIQDGNNYPLGTEFGRPWTVDLIKNKYSMAYFIFYSEHGITKNYYRIRDGEWKMYYCMRNGEWTTTIP